MHRKIRMSDFYARVAEVQKSLKAPKGQFNSFGKYKYRNCEDILEGLKAVLNGLTVHISDDVVMVGDRVYVKATATVTDGKDSLSVSAFARESESKKGMDDSQLTGSTSSYARKYALGGLFLIDDNKDADSQAAPVESVTTEKLSSQQVATVRAACEAAGTSEEEILSKAGVRSLEEIEASRFDGLIVYIQAGSGKK